ncbi:hypothetical protein BDR07DRAFT_398495 [Suillus spraguei]|nr:hypothetical protein BDR07DRAFT_398495 [Suillus spraguei]
MVAIISPLSTLQLLHYFCRVSVSAFVQLKADLELAGILDLFPLAHTHIYIPCTTLHKAIPAQQTTLSSKTFMKRLCATASLTLVKIS